MSPAPQYPEESTNLNDDNRADLVAFALGQLDESEATAVRELILAEPELAAEFDSIRCHLDLHAEVREMQPTAAGFARLTERLEQEPVTGAELRVPECPPECPPERTFIKRYWMSLAAAALLIGAIIIPRGPSAPAKTPDLKALAGNISRDASGAYTATGVARVTFGTGVTVMVDADSVLLPLDSQRLVLKTGRIFLNVEPSFYQTERGRRGFTVLAGDARLTTLGTAFSVEQRRDGTGRVAVETGTVRLQRGSERVDVGSGRAATWPDGPWEGIDSPSLPSAGAQVRWFEIPSLSAKILNDRRIVVVLKNEMINVIRLAPPTGGEPLFYATVGEHNWPHEPSDWGYNVVLDPGEEFTFEMKLPEPLKPGDSVSIRVPSLGMTTRIPFTGKTTETGTGKTGPGQTSETGR